MESLEVEDKLKCMVEDFDEAFNEVTDKMERLEDKNNNLGVKCTAI